VEGIMKTAKNILTAILLLIIGAAADHWWFEPTPMQKMLGIHDYMQNPAIESIWIQTYCKPEKIQKYCADFKDKP
jgi:hypothetical protein